MRTRLRRVSYGLRGPNVEMESKCTYRTMLMLVMAGESRNAVRIPRGLSATAMLRKLARSACPTKRPNVILGCSGLRGASSSSLRARAGLDWYRLCGRSVTTAWTWTLAVRDRSWTDSRPVVAWRRQRPWRGLSEATADTDMATAEIK